MFGVRSLIRNFTLRDTRVWLWGADTWSGKPVTPDTAMQLAAFWSCVRLISQTIATLPLSIYTRRPDGGRDAAPNHALYSLLHDSPSADRTAVEFWEGVAAHLCVWGNAFVEKVTSGPRIIALHLLRPDLMTVHRDQYGALLYRYHDPRGVREYGESDVLHVRGFGFGGDLGLSPVSYARQTLGAAMATDEAAARTFANGMRPGGFFTYDKTLTPDQREQAKKVLIEPYSGAENAAKVGILEAGFKWQDVVMPPHDAEMLASRQFHIEEICRWFGVPPVLVGHAANGVTAWGTGIESLVLGWLTLGLRPYLTRIEQAIKRSLIPPAERSTTYAEFAIEGLLRADSAGRAAFYSTMSQNGFMSRNEGRARENLPPDPSPMADALTVQSNLVPLSKLGTTPAARVQPAPGDPIPEPAA